MQVVDGSIPQEGPYGSRSLPFRNAVVGHSKVVAAGVILAEVFKWIKTFVLVSRCAQGFLGWMQMSTSTRKPAQTQA